MRPTATKNNATFSAQLEKTRDSKIGKGVEIRGFSLCVLGGCWGMCVTDLNGFLRPFLGGLFRILGRSGGGFGGAVGVLGPVGC
jgi:hypothetical protein